MDLDRITKMNKITTYSRLKNFFWDVGEQVVEKFDEIYPRFSHWASDVEYNGEGLTVKVEISGPYGYDNTEYEDVDEMFLDFNTHHFDIDGWLTDRKLTQDEEVRQRKLKQEREAKELHKQNLQWYIKILQKEGYEVTKK